MNASVWKPIGDLPADWEALRSPELENLAGLWAERKTELQDAGSVRQFNDELTRKWAIETGLIEGLYALDEGITRTLIERGLEACYIPHGCSDQPADEVVAILKDHEQVLQGLFDFIERRRMLSVSYIKEVQQALTLHQDTTAAIRIDPVTGREVLGQKLLLKGEFKELPNAPNPHGDHSVVTCPPEHVHAEMDRLVEMHLQHEEQHVPPEVEAAWIHHRFSQIHPFEDGNGRVARALATLIFLRAGWFPLVVANTKKSVYLDALAAADDGDLAPLVNLFASAQKAAFIEALGISAQVLDGQQSRQQLLEALKNQFADKHMIDSEKLKDVFELSHRLEEACHAELKSVSEALGSADGAIRIPAQVSRSGEHNHHYYKSQIIDAARQQRYFADTSTYRSWVRLHLSGEQEASLLVSFHGVGRVFKGGMAASAFLEYRYEDEDGRRVPQPPIVLSESPFLFFNTEADMEDLVVARFHAWLNPLINVALADLMNKL